MGRQPAQHQGNQIRAQNPKNAAKGSANQPFQSHLLNADFENHHADAGQNANPGGGEALLAKGMQKERGTPKQSNEEPANEEQVRHESGLRLILGTEYSSFRAAVGCGPAAVSPWARPGLGRRRSA